MIQPHGRAGKGFYFIPEIDEEVLVGFEGGKAEVPYVMGAHYNRKKSLVIICHRTILKQSMHVGGIALNL